MACEKVVPSGLYILAATPPKTGKIVTFAVAMVFVLCNGHWPSRSCSFYLQSNVIIVSHRFVSTTCLSWLAMIVALCFLFVEGLVVLALFLCRPSARPFRSEREGWYMPCFPSEVKRDACGADNGSV